MNLFFVRACLLCMFSLTVVSGQNLNYTSLTIPTELRKNANAVVRLESKTIDLKNVDEMEITYRRVITVFNKVGNRLVQAGVGYDDSRKVVEIEAVIYDSLGNEVKKMKSKDFRDESAISGSTLYSDSRILYLDYTPVSYPYTVDFTYKLETSVTVFIPSWTPLLNYYQSVEKCTYTINNNFGTELFFKEKNFDGYDIQKNRVDDTFTYEINNLKALKREDLSLNITDFAPILLTASKQFNANGVYGEASNWSEYGKWMYEQMLAGRQQLTPETFHTIKELTADTEDPLEKAKIIYDFVQNNTRYISVQVGIGGYRPITALEVDQVKYGDCKGLTNYTLAMLQAVGVSAFYAHVESGRHKVGMEKDFASLSQGDHVILNIPHNGKDYWVDCTSQIQPFGFVGDFTDDRDVLVMTPEGGVIKHTPRYLDSTNVRKVSGKIDLTTNGTIQGKLSIDSEGIEYDNRFYMERLPEIDQLKRYKNDWDYVNNLHITDINFENIKDSIVFKEKMKIEAESYATISGDRILFAPNILDKETAIPDRYRNRLLDFEIERGYLHETDFEIVLPEGYQIEAKPDNVELDSKYGRYTSSIEIKDRKIHYRRSFMEKHGKYPKEEYKAFRDFKRQVARHDNAKIVLLKITK